jgi:dipeptidyl aminopeptidase/acylaminoacyl peptidase
MLVEFLTILSLLLPAGQDFCSQSKPDSLQILAERYYSLSSLEMSNDGRWLTVRKSYCQNSDTILIFDSRNTEQPVGWRTKVVNIVFLNNDNILMQSSQQAELFDPQKQTSVCYKNVKKFKALSSNNQFALHYNEEERNKLELHDSSGKLLNTVYEANQFYTTENNLIYAVTESGNGKNSILHLENNVTETVYITTRKILYLEADPMGEGIMIHEQNPGSEFQEMLYLDLKTKATIPLNEVLPLQIKQGFSEVIREGTIYFLTIHVKKEMADSSIADLWYGNDSQLEEKFYPPISYLNFVWEPKEKRVREFGNDSLTTTVNIGSDRYFLCFDQYHLQDYTTYIPHLKVYVYDKDSERYSFLGITASELYFSGNTEYALSPENKEWYLYHLPSGSKKLIPGKDLGKPWFTDDGNAVLFEGEGALWNYDIESGKLTEAAVFRGYQTSIVNGESKGISKQNGYFRKQQLSFTKAIVIKLYDPYKNLTSYVLWHNGKSDTIVPPTAKRIQQLNYNKACEWFSWVEEDYNMPPQIVFKKDGVVGKVLYQSNKTDKTVLSLKQEIISYNSSDGVPLKGILYYPLRYKSSGQYPMVVHIYKVQSKKAANEYPLVSYGKANNDGFDLRLLLENGYFVYLPDIVYGEKGPGLSALECVNNSLDALKSNASIDKNKIGLIGHSHGGYETNFIATHSYRFATYVTGAGNSDIVRSYFSYNYNFHCPFYFQYESGQYEMKKSFSEDKEPYFQNNPIYCVDKVNAPVLLWTGEKDQNIYWEQTMEFYIGLKRNNKKVIAIFYPKEGHTINAPDASRDLGCRILEWFNYFLKGQNDVDWINKEMKEDAK